MADIRIGKNIRDRFHVIPENYKGNEKLTSLFAHDKRGTLRPHYSFDSEHRDDIIKLLKQEGLEVQED